MLTPPFKLSAGGMAALGAAVSAGALQSGDGQCCGHDHVREEHGGAAHAQARTRLYQLDTHLHCSVIGTCLSPAELRKLMGRHMDIKGKTDLELHHQAVGLAHENGDLSKAIHKALDQRHAAVIKGFAAAQTRLHWRPRGSRPGSRARFRERTGPCSRTSAPALR